MSINRSPLQKAKAIKGYGSYDYDISNAEIERVKSLSDGTKVKPKVITSLDEYVAFIKNLNTSFENPIFYRGQGNANYLLTPYCLREDPAKEHKLMEAFSRRFPDELEKCNTSMSKLVLMQHYDLPTRCLDISENPFAALYFACVPYKKYRRSTSKSKENTWGEIVLFREKEVKENREEKTSNKNYKRIKTIESSNVSISANTAFLENDFTLWQLGSRWKKDANQSYTEIYLDLRTIVRSSFIVRVPQNNPRIRNQRGAFILVNANEVHLKGTENERIGKKITELLMDSDETVTYEDLSIVHNYETILKEINTWDFCFSKIKPYDDDNEFELFKTDPFKLKDLFYRDDKDNQVVILIPPECKKKLAEELSHFNITEDFIYPDMDSVANEIREQIYKQ